MNPEPYEYGTQQSGHLTVAVSKIQYHITPSTNASLRYIDQAYILKYRLLLPLYDSHPYISYVMLQKATP
jgi:hypothetical protein